LGGDEPPALDALELDALSDALTGGILDGIPQDAQAENTVENDETGIVLEPPDDAGTTRITLDVADQAELDGETGAPPTDAGGQPPAEPKETKYSSTTTPLDTSESQEEPGLEAMPDEPEEEDVDLVDPNNPVARFVGDLCVVQDGEVTSARDLYIAYLRWCDENIEPPMPQRGFGMILTQMGFNRRRRGRSRNWSWWGVGLGNTDTGDEDADLDPDSGSDYADDPEGEE